MKKDDTTETTLRKAWHQGIPLTQIARIIGYEDGHESMRSLERVLRDARSIGLMPRYWRMGR